ncbi:MAG TPA: AarF/UbiB family protein, partial [Hyphomicrobiales bacterium]|nr:AarF/UbiB family protein [Hyphomicrobiales bacterium]
RNAERVAANFADDPFITIPTIYWEWTAERLNVQQYVAGVPGTDLDAVDAAGLDRKLLAARGADAVLKMILEDRFFHADPHPGNVFYLPGNTIVFIDFGMTGYLSEPRARQLTDLLGGIIEHDTGHVLDVLLAWSPDSDTDEAVLATELDAFIDRVHGLPLKALDLPNLIFDLVALMREHRLSLPPDLSLLTKAFVTLEGMGRQLDPDFDVGAAAMPYVQRLLLARFTLAAIAARGRRSATDLVDLLADLPADLKKLIRSAQKGSLRMRVGVDRLDQVVGRMDRAISRLTMGIVIAALILGSSTVMTASGVEVPFGVPFFAMLGFFAAIVGGAWLVYSIWANRQ